MSERAPQIGTNPEISDANTRPEKKEHLEKHSKTAKSIDNVSRMLAKKANKIGSYGKRAALAPQGYSQIGRQSTSELYVKESGIEPGDKPQSTKIVLNGNDHLRASITTEPGIAEGVVESKHTGVVEHTLGDQDVRDLAAAALWEKRQELRGREDSIRQLTSTAVGSIVAPKN